MKEDRKISDVYIVRKCLAKKAYSVANSKNCEKYLDYLEEELSERENRFSNYSEEDFLEGTAWILNEYATQIGGENVIGLIRERRNAIRKAGNELPLRYVANAYDRISNLYDTFTKQAP